jgi:hypothetical protein
MLLPSQRHSMARPTSRSSFRIANPAPPVPHTYDRFAVRGGRIRDHLLRDHGRTGREIDGMALADLHRFEHVEQAMGLNGLGHQHPAPVGNRAHVAADATARIPVKLS